MRISERDKKLLILVGIVLIIGATYVNLYYSTSHFNKFFSVNNIDSKKETYLTEVNNVSANNEKILSKKSNIESLKTQIDESNMNLSDLKNKINEDELKLDIPSFLIKVETIANNNNVTLNLQYDLVKLQGATQSLPAETTAGMPPTTEEMPPMADTPTDTTTDTSMGVPIDTLTDNSTPAPATPVPEVVSEVPNVMPSDNSNKDINIDTDMSDIDISSPDYLAKIIGEYQQPVISGVKVASFPLAITGTYDNVYKFLNDLSSIEYLQPGSLQMMSEGKNIYCTIILNIFYK